MNTNTLTGSIAMVDLYVVYNHWMFVTYHRVTDSWDYAAYLTKGGDDNDCLWIIPCPNMWMFVD